MLVTTRTQVHTNRSLNFFQIDTQMLEVRTEGGRNGSKILDLVSEPDLINGRIGYVPH